MDSVITESLRAVMVVLASSLLAIWIFLCPALWPLAPEAGSGFDPWATPATPGLPTAEQHDPAQPVASVLPPNLAPEGTQPRQPYLPADSGV